MNNRAEDGELAEILNRVAARFPDQPEWRELVMELGAETQGNGSEEAAAPQPAADGACSCCGRRPPADSHGLCESCQALYVPTTARVIDDTCGCGHAPVGPEVYVYAPDSQGLALCSIECVRKHWIELFGFFARRSST